MESLRDNEAIETGAAGKSPTAGRVGGRRERFCVSAAESSACLDASLRGLSDLAVTAPRDRDIGSPIESVAPGTLAGVDSGMNVKQIKAGREGMHVLVFATGDEVMTTLRQYAEKQGIQAARLTGIGAFQSATLAYFDWESKTYEEIVIDDQVEVLVLTGDIAMKEGKPEPHVHVVLGRRDGSTRGGHLCRAIVRPTLELMLEAGGALVRRFDPASGLALIAPEA